MVKAFPTVLPIDLSTLLDHATFGNLNVLVADMLLLRSLHNLRQANVESTRDDIPHPPVHTTNKYHKFPKFHRFKSYESAISSKDQDAQNASKGCRTARTTALHTAPENARPDVLRVLGHDIRLHV